MAKETFGQRLSALRKEKGLTQNDIADKVGVTAQAVSKWENDQSSPDIDCLLTLADLFGITVDELLGKPVATPVLAQVAPSLDELEKMVLRIKIRSKKGDNINVNLPFALVKMFVNKDDGQISMLAGNKELEGIDFRQLVDLVERGVVGELVTMESAEGDTVRVVVEK